jgi:hypothetical protein|tara:strand:+ start:858 stop:1295 length:438 start_codon:yes stop_codon:yes gene_type:complete
MAHKSHLLKPEEVLKNWSSISPHIEKALEHSAGEISLLDIARDVLNLSSHIWVTFSGETLVTVIVTRFLNYERTKMLQVMACTGGIEDWASWTEHHRILEDFAKKHGCSAMSIWGRKGWGRRLQHLKSRSGNPYTPLYSVFKMEI